jgi:hypothetical protein
VRATQQQAVRWKKELKDIRRELAGELAGESDGGEVPAAGG